MFAFSIWSLELELFGVNLLIVFLFCVIAEYSRFRGANSQHNLSLEFGLFETGFKSGFRSAKSKYFSHLKKKRFKLRFAFNCVQFSSYKLLIISGNIDSLLLSFAKYSQLVPFSSQRDDLLSSQKVKDLDDYYKIC